MIIVDNPITVELNGKEYPVIQNYQSIKDKLDQGTSIVHWEGGDSLFPIIKNMEYCKVEPAKKEDVHVGDCVFCLLNSKWYMVHRVLDIVDVPKEGLWFKIGDTWGSVYGWTQNVYGIATSTGVFQKEKPKRKWVSRFIGKA